MLATFILLITSLVFRLKKKPNTKKYFKFTGIAFILSIISLIVVNMNMTPQEKQEILAKQKAEEKLKSRREAKRLKNKKKLKKNKKPKKNKKLKSKKKLKKS